MKNKRSLMLMILLAGLGLFLPLSQARADMPPVSAMSYEFRQEGFGLPLQVTSARQYECAQSDCSDALPLVGYGGNLELECSRAQCRAANADAYYHQLVITFSDGVTRRSNVFHSTGFDATYLIIIRATDLQVQEKPAGEWSIFGISLPASSALSLSLLGCFIVGLMLAGLGGVAWYLRRGKKPSSGSEK